MSEDATEIDRALRVAAQHGQAVVVDVLLAAGATRYSWGLDAAACYGHKDLVEKFLGLLGADAPKYVSSPMDGAAHRGHTDIVRLFIDKYGAVPTAHTLFQAQWGKGPNSKICTYIREQITAAQVKAAMQDGDEEKTK